MTFPPLPQIPFANLGLEDLMDALTYLLATDSHTSEINWVMGDVGIGAPPALPFGYVTHITESVSWYTSNGGLGGLSTGLKGYDDWVLPIVLTVAFEPHRYPDLLVATPPSDSPFYPTTLGVASLPYQETPGYRGAMQVIQKVKATLRLNPTIGGAASDTRIVESRYVLQDINSSTYRAARMTIQTQQRRVRGN